MILSRLYQYYTTMVGKQRFFNIAANGWRYGLVKADHYRPIKEQNLIQPLLTIPLVMPRFYLESL